MKSLILGAFLFISSLAQATTEARYRVQIDTQGDGASSELITWLAGLNCSSSTTARFSEVMKDHQGQPKQIEKASDSSYRYSTLFSGGRDSVYMDITRNLYNTNPRMDVSINESCTKPETCYRAAYDEDGSYVGQESYDCSTTYSFSWNCSFDENAFPTQEGRSASSLCHPKASTYSSGDYFGGLLYSFLRDKEINATLSLESVQETFAHNACSGQGEEHVLHIEQGLRPNIGEDDFQFIVTINGQDYTMLSQSGLYAEDIKVCSANGQLDFAVRGIEKDLFDDDKYTATQSSYSLQLRQGSQAEILLQRKGWFGTKESRVKATILR